MDSAAKFTAFSGDAKLASGSRTHVVRAIRTLLSDRPTASILIFDDATGGQIDFDLRDAGEARIVTTQPNGEETRSPGRPKLGVVAREVTLLPRHWDWLAKQPGGASVTLRKLVEDARRANAGTGDARQAQERAYKFMSAMAGNLPGFEEAARALFAKDRTRFEALTAEWPADVCNYARKLAAGAFASST
jgi:hypothetical protein